MVSAPLAKGARLDPTTLWKHLQRLAARVASATGGDTLVDDCLDIVIDILGADRGFVLLEEEGGTPQVVNARGPRRALTAGEREEVSRTIIRGALDADSIVAWVAADEPATSQSAHSLGIGAALAGPLRARGFLRGVLYVDFRSLRPSIDSAERELFMAAVAIMSGMIGQASMAREARDHLEAAHGHLTEARRTVALDDLVQAPGLQKIRPSVQLALIGDSPVFILGESGTGKTLFAQALAEASGRRPIARIVLGGSDDLNTIASELFGHERGAFSGATTKRVGLVEYAHGGTLVFDEVLNLPAPAQKLLLDFTQFGTYRPLGYDKAEPKRAMVRIVAATNGDMRAAIREGRFREDLYYRLAGVTIKLPPLRERRGDIPALAEASLQRADPTRRWELSMEVRRHLASSSHDWPGNVRELEWTIRRARDRMLMRDGTAKEIRMTDLGELAGAAESRRAPAAEPAEAWKRLQEAKAEMEEREADILREVLARHGGVVAHAAKELGIARTTLAGRVEMLGVGKK